jgi:hypothetical protein
VKIELFKIPGCSGADIAYDRLRDVLDKLGICETIRTIEIATEEQARRLRFPGSPTLRVDGVDVDPSDDRSARYAVACRLYKGSGSSDNAPSVAAIGRSLDDAVERSRRVGDA